MDLINDSPTISKSYFSFKDKTSPSSETNQIDNICTRKENSKPDISKPNMIFKITKIYKQNKIIRKRLKKIKAIHSEVDIDLSLIQSEDKVERLKTLAKSVKIMRRKIKTMEKKLRLNSSKILNQHIWNSLSINPKNIYLKNQYKFDYDNVLSAFKKIKEKKDFEFEDQKHVIENLINLIVEEKLKPGSIIYNQICNILRMYISPVKQINEKYEEFSVKVDGKDLPICYKDYKKFSKFNDEALKACFGVEVQETLKEEINPYAVNLLSYLQPNFNLFGNLFGSNTVLPQNPSKRNDNNMFLI
jgi:hypothetical protein